MPTKYPERTFTFGGHVNLPSGGPWVDEPDKVQWVDESTDLDCLIVRNRLGSLCGYVGVPEDHPAYGMDAERVHELIPTLTVHGDVNFAQSCQEGLVAEAVCHVPYDGRPKDVWWLGFDCAHGYDLCPGTQEMADLLGYVGFKWQRYRDVAYVKDEVKLLALQLAAAR